VSAVFLVHRSMVLSGEAVEYCFYVQIVRPVFEMLDREEVALEPCRVVNQSHLLSFCAEQTLSSHWEQD
jgi:hypothetical protein